MRIEGNRGWCVPFLLCVITLTTESAAAQNEAALAKATISSMAWLAGAWRMSDQALSIEEHWTPAAGDAMLAVSRTVRGTRMVAFEFLRIVERNGGLVYIAQPNGQPPTEFVLTSVAKASATFENPKHDFPKRIQYALRADGKLEARVSDGGQKAESFVFTRIQ